MEQMFVGNLFRAQFSRRTFQVLTFDHFYPNSTSILHQTAHSFASFFISYIGPIQIELIGKDVKVSRDMAIFITMNPGYAGRSNLPDNLKKLFRSLAMTRPDGQLIAQVMLYSQGFRTAEKLASKIVPFFKLVCKFSSCS